MRQPRVARRARHKLLERRPRLGAVAGLDLGLGPGDERLVDERARGRPLPEQRQRRVRGRPALGAGRRQAETGERAVGPGVGRELAHELLRRFERVVPRRGIGRGRAEGVEQRGGRVTLADQPGPDLPEALAVAAVEGDHGEPVVGDPGDRRRARLPGLGERARRRIPLSEGEGDGAHPQTGARPFARVPRGRELLARGHGKPDGEERDAERQVRPSDERRPRRAAEEGAKQWLRLDRPARAEQDDGVVQASEVGPGMVWVAGVHLLEQCDRLRGVARRGRQLRRQLERVGREWILRSLAREGGKDAARVRVVPPSELRPADRERGGRDGRARAELVHEATEGLDGRFEVTCVVRALARQHEGGLPHVIGDRLREQGPHVGRHLGELAEVEVELRQPEARAAAERAGRVGHAREVVARARLVPVALPAKDLALHEQEPPALGGAERPGQKLLVEGVRRRRIPRGRPSGHREQGRHPEGRRALPQRLDRLLGAGPVAGVEQGLHESDVDQVMLLGLAHGREQRAVHLHCLRGAVGAVEPPAEMQERRGEQRRRWRVLDEAPELVDRGAILAEPTQALAEPEPGLAGEGGGGAFDELRPRLPGLLPPAQEREGERATASSRDQERLRRGPRPTERAVEGVEGPRGLAELEGRPAARVQGETGEVVGRPLLGDLDEVLVGLRDSVDLVQGFTEPVPRQSCGVAVWVLPERVLEVLDGLHVPPVVIVLAPAVDERADAPEQGADQVAADGTHREDGLRDRRVEDEPRGRQRRERRGGRRDRQLRHREGRLLERGTGDLDERGEVGGRQDHRGRGGCRGHERGPREPEQKEAASHDSVAGFFSVDF